MLTSVTGAQGRAALENGLSQIGAGRDPAATEDYGDRLSANDVMVYTRKLGDVSARVEGRIILR